MRHFRTADDILDALVEEHARQGIPVHLHDGQAFVAVTEEEENGAITLREFNLSEAAARIWGEFHDTRH